MLRTVAHVDVGGGDFIFPPRDENDLPPSKPHDTGEVRGDTVGI